MKSFLLTTSIILLIMAIVYIFHFVHTRDSYYGIFALWLYLISTSALENSK